MEAADCPKTYITDLQASAAYRRNRRDSVYVLVEQIPENTESKDDAEIRSLLKTFAAATNTLDPEGTMACYANQRQVSVFSPRPRKPIVGLAAIRKNWGDFFALLKPNHSELSDHSQLSDITIQTDGSLAFAYFTSTNEIAGSSFTNIIPFLAKIERIGRHFPRS